MRGLFAASIVMAMGAVGAPAVAKPAPDLRFATYNVCKTTCAGGKYAWSNRGPAVVRNIVSAQPDVVALQEVNNSYEWLEQQLGSRGYRMVQSRVDDCTARGVTCVDDSRLFYRTAAVTPVVTPVPSEPVSEQCRAYVSDSGELPAEPAEPTYPDEPTADAFATTAEWLAARRAWQEQMSALRSGYQLAWREYGALMDAYDLADERYGCSRFIGRQPSTEVGSGLISWATIGKPSLVGSAENRNFSWAVLRDNRTGGAFLAVSLHMPNEKTGLAEAYRVNLARALVKYLRSTAGDLGARRLPVVLMGDFNSYAYRQPRGAQWVFGRMGFRDAYTARTRVNEQVPTINVTSRLRNPFPAKPFRFDRPARLDYVMVNKGRIRRYEVHLRLRPGGWFDDRYRGSDHNLVLADLALPRVKLGPSWVAGD